ncbi:MAG: SDR family oxidoreductase [Gemmatimonadota bacterium]|nr:SDR family oxidoreductase [Gemmatimonadota bacterium]
MLAGRTAIVTGGGSGINQRIAERLADQGATVALIGRTQSKLDVVAEGIVASGGVAAGFAADVRDYDALAKAVAAARERFGLVAIVICGAAGNFPALANTMSANAFKSVVDIDLLGTFNTCRAAFEHLAVPGASIVNISAPQALQAMAMQAHVCAAKAGVDMLTKCLALEWGPLGVRVNGVIPGAVADTEGMDRLAPPGPIRDSLAKKLPLQRVATKDDIADTVLYLCSDAAKYVTGAIVPCDGGMTAAAMSIPIPRPPARTS